MAECEEAISHHIQVFADAALHQTFFDLTKRLSRETAETASRVEGLNDTYLDHGDTYAVYAGNGSFLTQAKGVFTAEQVEAVTAFFRSHGCSWEAIVTPFEGHEALQRLIDAGGKIEQWESLLYRSLVEPPCEAELGECVEVVEVGAETLEDWSGVMRRGFFGEETTPELEKLGRIFTNLPNVHRYLATVDGTPAAGASTTAIDGAAYLSGAATLPEFRGRGMQNALINRRLRDLTAIASVVFVGALPGGSSQRNMERHGFRVAFNQLSLRMP